MANTWNEERAKKAIDTRLSEVRDVTVVDYSRDTSLTSIPINKAYRMDAVHLYADILNLDEMLNSTTTEGETCHKRTLRFLDLHYRAVDRILARAEAIHVDFHNQRLHAVVAKPYGTEKEMERVNRAVAIAQLTIDVLAETGDDDEQIPNAKVRVGIDTGRALAVNNGRRGMREPMFLGSPANRAAKLASSGNKVGIYLTNEARKAINLKEVTDKEAADTPLTADEIQTCVDAANLDISKDSVVKEWQEDNKNNPIGKFAFSRATPPLSDLDISALTPANSKRMEMVSVYADVDNFTAYVANHIDDDPEDVVRCLHVIRSELDRVLTNDFGGRRIRFIGDCIHGHLMEGTAKTTDVEETISTAAICVAALRSSFGITLEKLRGSGVETDDLGLAIGFEFGPGSISRLGIHGKRVRCSTGRSVLESENEQRRCDGTESAIGQKAYDDGPAAVRNLFGAKRKKANLTYDTVVVALAADGDRTAKATQNALFIVAAPAMVKAAEAPFRPHAEG